VFPDERVSAYVSRQFQPVRIHIDEQPALFERFGVHFTPRLVMMDSGGVERHRIEGYLPADDLLVQFHLGMAHAAFARGLWGEAERGYRELAQAFSDTEAAPEALYWSAASAYKLTGNVAVFPVAASKLRHRYPQSIWTRKASVWL